MASLTSTLTLRMIDDLSKPARTVSQALKDAARDAQDMAKGMANTGATDRFVSSLSKIKVGAKDINTVAQAWVQYSKSAGLAANSADWTKAQAANVRQWESQTISALRKVKAEQIAFNRSISGAGGGGIGFGSNIVGGMSSIGAAELAKIRNSQRLSAGMSGAGQAAAMAVAAKPSKVQQAEARAKATAEGGGTSLIPLGGGLLPMAGAYGAYEAASAVVHAGVERQHALVGAENAGISPADLKRAEAASIAATKGAPNLSATEILTLFKEARSAVQHPEETFHLIPDLAKAASVLKGSGVENANIADLVKGGESLGLMNDPKRFHAFLEGQVKAMQVMGKTISTEQIYEAAKYSKSAGATLSDEFLNTTLPSLIQEMHGSSAGDAMAMLVKTLRGGVANKHLPVQKLNELGLLEEPSKIRKNKAGQIMGYAGKVVGDEMLASDPRKWFQEILKPAAEKAGYVTLSDQVRLLNQTLPQTAANLGRIFLQQEKTLEQHRKNYEAAPGLDQAVANQTRDAKAGVMELKAALDDLGAAVSASPAIGLGLHTIAEGLRSLPDPVKTLGVEAAATAGALLILRTGGVAATSAGLTGLGGGLVTATGLLGPFAAGLAATAGAFEAFKGLAGWIHEYRRSMGWLPSSEYEKGGNGEGPAAFDRMRGMKPSPSAPIDAETAKRLHRADTPSIRYGHRGTTPFTPGAVPLSGAAATRGADYSIGHMRPEFRTRLEGLMAEAKASGVPLSVFSGYRDDALQARLYAASHGSGMVGRPGHSQHGKGIGADLRGNLAWAHEHAAKYGLNFPYLHGGTPHPEPWHIGLNAREMLFHRKEKAGRSHDHLAIDMDGAGAPAVAPDFDHGPVVAYRREVQGAIADLQKMHEMTVRPNVRLESHGRLGGILGRTQRGHFSTAGVQGD